MMRGVGVVRLDSFVRFCRMGVLGCFSWGLGQMGIKLMLIQGEV